MMKGSNMDEKETARSEGTSAESGKPAEKEASKPAERDAGKAADPAGSVVPADAAASAPSAPAVSMRNAVGRIPEYAGMELGELKAAADEGDTGAMRAIGNRYKNGDGVEKDFAQMEQWWQKAADAGNTTAQWDLGYFYLIGMYLKKDTDKALEYYGHAVDNGNADAAFELGLDYENGQFVERDLDAAGRWMERAEKLGHPKAAAALKKIDTKKRKAEKRNAHREKVATDTTGDSDIVLDHITQEFGKHTVLDDINLRIKGNELIAIVGGSGGGKSTLINIIRGELKPTSGTVTFRGDFGFVPQKNLIHESLTVRQQLEFYATAVKRLPSEERGQRIDEILGELDLKKDEGNTIRKCSGGEQRRVSVACELLSRPDSLLLDEPTSGLDPGDSGDLIEVLRELVVNGNMTVIVINHDYENIKLFDKIVFLAKGQVCFYGTPAKLFKYFDTTSSRSIYDLIRENPDPYIRRFENWRTSNPGVAGGIQ